jgi:hypothetical protein
MSEELYDGAIGIDLGESISLRTFFPPEFVLTFLQEPPILASPCTRATASKSVGFDQSECSMCQILMDISCQ